MNRIRSDSIQKKKNILDLGCGDGALIYDLYEKGKINSKTNLYGIDINPRNIEIIRKKFPRCSFQVADAEKLPYKNSFFDFVYSWMVIEHVRNPQKMVSEISRVLKKNCNCYVSSIMKKPWAVYFYRNNGKFVLDPTHINEFESIEEYKQVFLNNGFKIISFSKVMRSYSVVELILKLLLKIKILKESDNLRNIFYTCPTLNFIKKFFMLPVFGFYQVEILCKKVK
ncbi:class I SAM-dependent methyltransferase [Patescibacteria group bacterium]